MLAVGDPIPAVAVWTTPREQVRLPQLVEERAALLVFHLFDWSAT